MGDVKVLSNSSMCNIYPVRELENLVKHEKSCVKLVESHRRRVDVSAMFVGDIWFGIRCMLYQSLKKFDSRLKGILLGFENIRVITGNRAVIISATGEITCHIIADFYVFQPFVGARLKGVVKRKYEEHITAFTLKHIKVIVRKTKRSTSEDWFFRHIQPGDKFKFVIIDYDFTGKVPIIEGRMD